MMTLHYNGMDDGSPELIHYGVVGMKWHHHRASVYAGRYNAAKARGNTAAAQRYMNKYSQHLNKNINNASPSKYNTVSDKDIKRARTINNVTKGVGAAAVAAGGAVGYRAYSKAIKRTPSERAASAQASAQAREFRERMNYARGAGARIQRNANRVQKPPSMKQQQKAFRKGAGIDIQARANGNQTPPRRIPNDYAERLKRTQDRLKEYQEAVNKATNGTTNKKRRR